FRIAAAWLAARLACFAAGCRRHRCSFRRTAELPAAARAKRTRLLGMTMASHVIDDMVLDIAFEADAGLRDDEWRSYLSAKRLPAIASVLDWHSHRDGVLVLPQVELDLGDIPLDDFQEEMIRR